VATAEIGAHWIELCINHGGTKGTKTLQHDDIEVDQKPDALARDTHVVQKLRVVYGYKLLNRLQFQNDLFGDDKIQVLLAQQFPPIRHLERLFAFKRNPGGRQLKA
jgi:hypothetical protein